ncbi:MAG TPA: 50S ribosomal protein L3 N(5)-glutamine methyltransferase [Burkholderiales bacterium]|nr:50S ribosomal protein L3 N(5)-glutamine methyltransferase [Burkholderiales bacterium]
MFAEGRSTLRTVRDCLRFAVSRFNEAGLAFGHGCDNAFDEAAYLILHALRLPPDRLEPFLDARLTRSEVESVLELLRRRAEERVPAAYLTHEAWLGEYRFYVDERVIVPRSHIADLLREGLAPWVPDPAAVARVLDLCTGSGCLAILAALAFPNAQVEATDLSAAALEVARRNLADYGLESRVDLHQADLYGELSGRRYDVILSNPPYVPAASMASLPAEYRAEPQLALAGGKDGLDFVRRILAGAAARITQDGVLVVEIGDNRDALERAFPALEFAWPSLAAGGERVFVLTDEQLP